MKKLLAILLCMMMIVPAAASLADENVTITLWTYPIGKWVDDETVKGFIADFNAVHPEITVNVQYLDYTTGDDQVTSAIQAGTTPDVIFEGPERLVANWGAAGKMLDISDLWADTKDDIVAASPAVEAACKNADGKPFGGILDFFFAGLFIGHLHGGKFADFRFLRLPAGHFEMYGGCASHCLIASILYSAVSFTGLYQITG